MMKKEYIKPTLATETIDVELPISTSLDVFGSPDNVLEEETDFLSNKRYGNDWDDLW